MQRTPEPELMDDPQQAEAYAAADFASTDAAFVAEFCHRYCQEHAGLGPGPLVDLGCGPGNITLRLAEALPARAIVGVDGSGPMLAIARARAAGFGSRVTWVEALLPAPSLPRGGFAAVLGNSLLHHLEDPRLLWATVAELAAPGAAIWIGDLRRPASEAEAEALVERYAGDAPPVLRADFLASLHAAYEPDEVRAQLAAAGLPLVVEAVGDRHLRVHGRLSVGDA